MKNTTNQLAKVIIVIFVTIVLLVVFATEDREFAITNVVTVLFLIMALLVSIVIWREIKWYYL